MNGTGIASTAPLIRGFNVRPDLDAVYAAGVKKMKTEDEALGRSRGGFSTKPSETR